MTGHRNARNHAHLPADFYTTDYIVGIGPFAVLNRFREHRLVRHPVGVVDVAAFERDGYLRIDQPELRGAAEAARAALWAQIGRAPDDPASWTRPVCGPQT